MRFSLLHKVTTYLMVLSGFAALALSGELSPALVAIALVGGAASAFVEPAAFGAPSSRGWTWAWNLASLAVFAWSLFRYAHGDALILCGVRLLLFLQLNKLWNRRAAKDYVQAYLLSFLMLVAGTTLNTELVYALCFVAYVVFATWALTLFHLRREMEENYLLKHADGGASERVEVERILNSRRVVGGSFLAATSLVSASVFLASSVFFFLFPRVGFNAFARHNRHGLTVGFNDRGVELGGNGLLKDNQQVVMRVEFPDGRPPEPLYFRGISFDRYEAGRWTPSGTNQKPLRRVDGRVLVGMPARLRPTDNEVAVRYAGAVRQEIYLEPMDTTVLFAASAPQAVQVPGGLLGGPQTPTVMGGFVDEAGRGATGDLYAVGRTAGIHYSAWSQPGGHIDAPVRDLERDLAAYLDTRSIPPRIVALSAEIVRGHSTPSEKAAAIAAYLRRGFRYTLEQAHEEGREPMEEFLFERRAGHCEYFASAMALLLRAAGIPTRHVAGFYGGTWNELGRYLQVRQGDAHAWVEAWIDGGWVSFDPTPPTMGSEVGLGSRARELLDVLELAWFKYVLEYDLGTQMDLAQKLRRALWSGGASDGSLGGAGPSWKLDGRMARRAGIAGAAVFGLVWALRTLRRGGARRERRLGLTGRALERAARALARRGHARHAAETPAAFARRIAREGDLGAAAYAELVELYYADRFGQRSADGARVRALVDQVVRARPAA